MNCASCGQELPKEDEDIVEKTEQRMKEYSQWLFDSLANPDLPRLPWDVKSGKFYSYGDIVKK